MNWMMKLRELKSKMMNNSDIIEEYIRECYIFTSYIDGWCVYDKFNKYNIALQRMVKEVEKVFPDTNSADVCTKWWAKNLVITLDKINMYLSKFRVKIGTRPKVWDVINHNGKEFDFNKLLKVLPSHHNSSAIHKIYDKWFDEKITEATTRMVGS